MNKNFDYYCLTVRKCSNVKTYKQAERVLKDYDYYIKSLQKNTDILDVTVHHEVKMNLKKHFNIHIHCTIKVEYNADIFCKPKKGFSIRLERVKSLRRWNSYVGKQNISRSDILLFVQRNLTPPIVPHIEDDPVIIQNTPYVPNSEDLEAFEEFIQNAPNYREHIKK